MRRKIDKSKLEACKLVWKKRIAAEKGISEKCAEKTVQSCIELIERMLYGNAMIADELRMPEEYKIYCREHGIKYVEHTDFTEETIADADILYMTRVQRERFTDLMEYERVKNVYILRNKMLEHTRPNLRILHPLPRVNEIAYDVDDNPKAYYFQQAQNGLYAREAILCDVLGITLDEVKKSKGVIQ